MSKPIMMLGQQIMTSLDVSSLLWHYSKHAPELSVHP